METVEEAARVAQAHWRLDRHTALLLARPADGGLDDLEPLIEKAVTAATERGVSGQAVTPFVLAYLHEHTGGRTIAVNKRLIVDNAGLAAEVAAAFSALS